MSINVDKLDLRQVVTLSTLFIFMLVVIAPDRALSQSGGSYTLKGDDYVETPEYGLGDTLDQLKGKPQEFKGKVEGNKWHHTGKLSSGTTIEEVWERVEKK